MKLKTVIAAIMAAGFVLPMVANAGEEKFHQLDVNQDGVIDREEAAAEPNLAAAFDEVNVAGTGELTIEEFSAWEEVQEESTAPGMAPESTEPGMAPESTEPKAPGS